MFSWKDCINDYQLFFNDETHVTTGRVDLETLGRDWTGQ